MKWIAKEEHWYNLILWLLFDVKGEEKAQKVKEKAESVKHAQANVKLQNEIRKPNI